MHEIMADRKTSDKNFRFKKWTHLMDLFNEWLYLKILFNGSKACMRAETKALTVKNVAKRAAKKDNYLLQCAWQQVVSAGRIIAEMICKKAYHLASCSLYYALLRLCSEATLKLLYVDVHPFVILAWVSVLLSLKKMKVVKL